MEKRNFEKQLVALLGPCRVTHQVETNLESLVGDGGEMMVTGLSRLLQAAQAGECPLPRWLKVSQGQQSTHASSAIGCQPAAAGPGSLSAACAD